jgi:hypothetical protein
MNLRLIGSSMGAVVLGSVLGACGASQQDPQCVVARAVSDGSTGSFATTYTLKAGQDPKLTCAQLKPEPVGLQKYFNRDSAAKDTVAIRTARVGKALESAVLDPDAPNQPNSVGALATDTPGPDNFCDVPTLSPTRVEARASGPSPALSLTYAWSNLRIYNTTDIPGTQFVADLRYTENGCSAEFSVKGIWPVVSCGSGTPKKANETLCDPYPDFNAGRLRGSGINPLFPVKCDPVAFICVLTGEVPSDKKH